MSPPEPLVFIFLDGVGIGPAEPTVNPTLTAGLATLDAWLGTRPTLDAPIVRARRGAAFPLDATLGVPGRPQSGTGQTSLLTGINAADRFGRHFGPWTPVSLRPLLAEHNVLSRSVETGAPVAFANAYPEGFLERVPTRRVAAPPLAADAAGLLTRHHQALARGDAVASGILNEGWRSGLGFDVPRLTAADAGRNLARLASSHRLTMYAHYDTDRAGHEGTMSAGTRALERVDRFLGGLLEALPAGAIVFVASDHGNVEELTGKHTRNPALGLALGTGSAPVAAEALDAFLNHGPLESILDVTPHLLGLLAGR